MNSLPRTSQWVRALVETVTAMLLCLIAVGILFRPGKAEPEKAICSAGVIVPHRGSFISILENPDGRRSSMQLAEADDILLGRPKYRRLLPTINPFCISLEPNGKRLFVCDIDGNIYSVWIDSDTHRLLGRIAKGTADQMACTRNGKSLVVQNSFGMAAWDVDWQSKDFTNPRWYHIDQSVTCFALDPNSETGIAVCVGGQNSELFEFSLHTGKLDRRVGEVSGDVQKIVIAPNSRWMVALQESGESQLFSRVSGELPWQVDSIPGLSSSLSLVARFSADSQLLVTGNSQCNGLVVWELAQRRIQLRTEAVESLIDDCEFLDSKHILSWNYHSSLHVWNLQSTSSEREIKLSFQ